MVSALPPGPREPPALQTARWLVRPIAFLEACRRRFGDAFSVRFLGFGTPMVMLSTRRPSARCTPGAATACRPGARCRAATDHGRAVGAAARGRRAPRRRRLMLPPFHGERMHAYESTVREAAEREIATWPRTGPSRAPRMQAVTLEVILRAVFGVTDPARRERLRGRLPPARVDTSAGLQFRCCCAAVRRPGPAGRRALAAWPRSTRSCSARSPSAGPTRRRRPSARTSCSLLVAARFEDGGRDGRPRGARPAGDAPARRPRDDGDRAGLDGGPAAAAPRRARPPAPPRSTPARTRTCARSIQESLRLRPVVPLAGRRLASELRVDGLDAAAPAPTSRPRSG